MFYDLNVQRSTSQEHLCSILKTLKSYGFDVVAVTTEINDENFSENKKQKSNKAGNRNSASIPSPIDVSLFVDLNIKIYNRINIFVHEPGTMHKAAQSKIIKQYDIISYLPGNSAVLKALTTVMDFDILSFNPTIDNPPIHFTKKLYKQFVQNGVYMELPYAPAIQDSSYRKNCIYTAHLYHAIGKSRNVILTSAGTNDYLFRSPYNVKSLAYLYGLSEEQAKYSISENCHMLLLRARTRRRGRSTMDVILQKEISVN